MIIERKMDYKGLIVRSKTELKNGWAELPPGKILTVTGWSRGLAMTSEPCPCCGIKLAIGRVDESHVEILECDYNEKRLAWNKKRKYQKGTHGRWLKDPDELVPKLEDYNYGKNPDAPEHKLQTIEDVLEIITPENIDSFTLDFTAFLNQYLLIKAAQTAQINPDAITLTYLKWKDDGIREGRMVINGKEV